MTTKTATQPASLLKKTKAVKVAEEQSPPTVEQVYNRNLEGKYGAEAMRIGHTSIPNLVIDNLHLLGLEPQVMHCVTIIFRFWYLNSKAWPKMQTIATMMNRSRRQVRRYVSQLRELDLVQTTQRYDSRGSKLSNEFDCDPIIKAVIARVSELAPQADGEVDSPSMSYGIGQSPSHTIGHASPIIEKEESEKESFNTDSSNLRSAAAQNPKGTELNLRSNGYTNRAPTQQTNADEANRKSNASYLNQHQSTNEENQTPNRKPDVEEAAAATPLPCSNVQVVKPTIYLKEMITDISTEFHDAEHVKSNVSQMLRLWQGTYMDDEYRFGELVMKARDISKKADVHKKNGKVVNRMPYFFRVLKGLVEEWEQG